MPKRALLPLFPLPTVVHFPHCELRLHVFEQRYQQLVTDLLARPASDRVFGMVLLVPRPPGETGDPLLSPIGTACRLERVEPLDDGRSLIDLRGLFRFQLEREVVGTRDYREAMVRELPDEEPALGSERALVLLRELERCVLPLAAAAGNRFPLAPADAEWLVANGGLPELVNRLAGGLDLTVSERLRLLALPLEERSLSVLNIVRRRFSLLRLLRPYRRLAAGAPVN